MGEQLKNSHLKKHGPITCAGIIALAVAAMSGCGGGGTTDLAGDVGIVTADYQVLTLSDGTLVSMADIPDLLTNDDYRTTKMVFRKLLTNTATIGSLASSFGYESDETRITPTVDKYYIAVFEITQRQWEIMAGDDPWNDVNPISAAGGVDAIGDSKPAFNMSFIQIEDATEDASRRYGHTLKLPTDIQWEYACRAGQNTIYAWGNDHTPAAATDHAVVWETATDVLAPNDVGNRSANDFGLYDMHGNIAEWTFVAANEGNVRGGSWQGSLPQARAANFLTPQMDIMTQHALVGARLVLVP
jgi:formylglycine-generating enzyme required for sulfatase activity